jgi:hypothetical protein
MATQTFLTAEWRRLAMLNYEIDPALLRPAVPRGTELDTWRGKTFISVVGFLFLRTRVLGAPIPFHQNFAEINLRFYVRRRADSGEWRRGVVFIKEIVPRWAIALAARLVYNENYVARPMRYSPAQRATIGASENTVEYGWRDAGRWNHLRVETNGEPRPLTAGAEEEFITEHYWGYAAQRDGGCVEYQVEHPPWRVWPVHKAGLDCEAAQIYGPQFAEALGAQPSSAFLAEGSPVVVRRGVRLC